jgi:hypothetical protein
VDNGGFHSGMPASSPANREKRLEGYRENLKIALEQIRKERRRSLRRPRE